MSGHEHLPVERASMNIRAARFGTRFADELPVLAPSYNERARNERRRRAIVLIVIQILYPSMSIWCWAELI